MILSLVQLKDFDVTIFNSLYSAQNNNILIIIVLDKLKKCITFAPHKKNIHGN